MWASLRRLHTSRLFSGNLTINSDVLGFLKIYLVSFFTLQWRRRRRRKKKEEEEEKTEIEYGLWPLWANVLSFSLPFSSVYCTAMRTFFHCLFVQMKFFLYDTLILLFLCKVFQTMFLIRKSHFMNLDHSFLSGKYLFPKLCLTMVWKLKSFSRLKLWWLFYCWQFSSCSWRDACHLFNNLDLQIYWYGNTSPKISKRTVLIPILWNRWPLISFLWCLCSYFLNIGLSNILVK